MKNKDNNKKGFSFPPQAEIEKVISRTSQPDYQRVNIGLLPNATEADKAKYKLCKSILSYEHENNLSERELREKLGINQVKLEHILFAHINELNLEELINCLGKLHLPYELKINSQYFHERPSSETR